MASYTSFFTKGVLIGNPVDKSISDRTHNQIFSICSLPVSYEKRVIFQENFEKEITFLKTAEYRWIAVTMPYKEKILPYVDVLSVDAEAIGAVNTISIEQGRWIGHNTDGTGALNAIERKGLVRGMDVLILGAGGTAKAIAYEAKRRGAHVYIHNRNREKAVDLANQLEVHQVDEIPKRYDCLVNATSVGMSPEEDLLPIKKEELIKNILLFDVIYAPRKTALIKLGEENGCTIVLGEEMFAELSYLQFQIALKNLISLDIVHQVVRSVSLAASLQ